MAVLRRTETDRNGGQRSAMAVTAGEAGAPLGAWLTRLARLVVYAHPDRRRRHLRRAVRLDGLRPRSRTSATSSAGRRSGSRATRRSTTTPGSSSRSGSAATSSTAPTSPSPSPSSSSFSARWPPTPSPSAGSPAATCSSCRDPGHDDDPRSGDVDPDLHHPQAHPVLRRQRLARAGRSRLARLLLGTDHAAGRQRLRASSCCAST